MLRFETEALGVSRDVIDILIKHADEVKRAKSNGHAANHDRVRANDTSAKEKWKKIRKIVSQLKGRCKSPSLKVR